MAHSRTFKAYSTEDVARHLQAECPKLGSSSRFVARTPSVLIPLVADLPTPMGRCTGLSFSDSTPLAVGHHARSQPHTVVAGAAARGTTALGWFSGFKLHRVVNACGDRLAWCLTRGNGDDRQPVPSLRKRVKGLLGKRFGDTGSLSVPLAEQRLVAHGVQLSTRLPKNRRNRLLPRSDQRLLRQRALIETSYDQLKNLCETLAHASS